MRNKDKKKAIDKNGDIHLVSDYFKSPEQVSIFLHETGLTEVFQNKLIKNLVDYVFGVEVGLDSNARKNRGGHIMESLVANIFAKNNIAFEQEVYYTEFPEIVKRWEQITNDSTSLYGLIKRFISLKQTFIPVEVQNLMK